MQDDVLGYGVFKSLLPFILFIVLVFLASFLYPRIQITPDHSIICIDLDKTGLLNQ